MNRRLVWRAPRWALEKFSRLLPELEGVDPEGDIAYAIRDEIRSLPGFPYWADDGDEITPEETTIRE